jgi:transposase-like protein
LIVIPFQSCQFHQVKNIVKYLTKKPKNEANRGLLSITYELKHSTYEEFSKMLDDWRDKYGKELDERTYSENSERWKRKRRYTHRRLRSAYKSLKNNMCVLFTYKMYDGMPNTTNELEWYFKLIKAKTNIHNGLEEERKKRVVLSLFAI